MKGGHHTRRAKAQARKLVSPLPTGAHSHVHDEDVVAALERAEKIGSTAVQIYLGDKQKTTLKYKYPISAEDSKKIKKILKRSNIKLFVHGNLTINLSRPTTESRRYSWMLDNVVYDMKTASKIGGEGVVVHLGATAGEMNSKTAYRNMIESVKYIIENSPKKVDLLIENTAGEGTVIAHELEELHKIWTAIPPKLRERVKICIDTCHAFAAGYDIRTCKGVTDFFERLDTLFGLRKNIALMHINDSMHPLGSRKDRHASIGEGYIFNPKLGGNPDALAYLVEYAMYYKIPMILETRDSKLHPKEVKLLKQWVKDIQAGKSPLQRNSPAVPCLPPGAKKKGGAKNANQRDILVDIFQQLHKIYESMGNTHRSRSYQRLAKIIATANRPITSVEDVKDLEGVTDKSVKKIEQILTTGRLDILEELKKDRKVLAATDLATVIGIGPEAAKRLVSQGVTSVPDLKTAFKAGKVKLNEDQQLGLKYYDAFSKKLSRADAEKYRKALEKKIDGLYPGTELELAGSYRMGKKLMKDIDILVILPNVEDVRGKSEYIQHIVAALEADGTLKDIFQEGDIQLMAAMQLPKDKTPRHVDLRLIPHHLLPFYRLHFGSGMDFSRKIKLAAKRQGYKLSEYGLYDLRKKVYAPGIKTEKDIFRALGVDYVPPSGRL